MITGMETQSRTVLPVYVYAGTWAYVVVTDKKIIVVFACRVITKIVYVNQTRLVNINNFNH